MSDIYKYLNLSRFSILGYSSKYERNKDDIISNLNHVNHDPSTDTIESLFRNNKINQVLNCEERYEYLVIDFNNFKNAFDDQLNFVSNIKYKKDQITRLIRQVGTTYKVLLTCQIQPQKIGLISPFTFSNEILHISEFVFTIGDKIEIVKNRFS